MRLFCSFFLPTLYPCTPVNGRFCIALLLNCMVSHPRCHHWRVLCLDTNVVSTLAVDPPQHGLNACLTLHPQQFAVSPIPLEP